MGMAKSNCVFAEGVIKPQLRVDFEKKTEILPMGEVCAGCTDCLGVH
jgi:hypothetical protein